MRLQLTLAAVALLPASAAHGQDREAGDGQVTATLSSYTDDDETQITTVLVQGDVQLPRRARLGGHVLVDSISSASVDILSAATPGFEETRTETGGEAGIAVGVVGELGVAVVRSVENDWDSWSLQATWARDFAQKNTRLTLGYGYVMNDVGRSGDDNFARSLDAHTVELGATQLLDERTLVVGTLTLQVTDGFQSSPYRYVPTADGRFSLLESHPDGRLRNALGVRVLRYLSGTGLEVAYRFYADDWGVRSHTVTTSVTFTLGGSLTARLRARGYYQGAADFWHERYETPTTFMSADRELSTFWDVGGGAKLGYAAGGLNVDLKLDVVTYQFLDYALLDGRTALVAGVGVGYAW